MRAAEDLVCDVCTDLGITTPTILAGDRYALFLVAGTPCGAACDDCWVRTLEEMEHEQAAE